MKTVSIKSGTIGMKQELKFKVMLADEGGIIIHEDGHREVFVQDNDMHTAIGEYVISTIQNNCQSDAEVVFTIDMKEDRYMEHAIGTKVILLDGRKAEVVEDPTGAGCTKCFLDDCEFCWECKCRASERADRKNIIYKEVKNIDLSYGKYLQEKAQLEAYGHTSVITYEEWKQIKEE